MRDAKKLKEDEEQEIPAQQRSMSKPNEKVNTEAYPQSILHALASNIERDRKSVSESHIHPSDPDTDIIDIDNKKERDTKSKEVDAYQSRINTIIKRKKELHDLLGK